ARQLLLETPLLLAAEGDAEVHALEDLREVALASGKFFGSARKELGDFLPMLLVAEAGRVVRNEPGDLPRHPRDRRVVVRLQVLPGRRAALGRVERRIDDVAGLPRVELGRHHERKRVVEDRGVVEGAERAEEPDAIAPFFGRLDAFLVL